MLIGLALIFVLGAIASTLAVWKVIFRTNAARTTFQTVGRVVSIDIYKFAYVPAVIATGCMLAMTIATIVWSFLVFSALPGVFFGNFGLWMTSTSSWVYGIIILMLISSLTAVWGVVRGRSALAQTRSVV